MSLSQQFDDVQNSRTGARFHDRYERCLNNLRNDLAAMRDATAHGLAPEGVRTRGRYNAKTCALSYSIVRMSTRWHLLREEEDCRRDGEALHHSILAATQSHTALRNIHALCADPANNVRIETNVSHEGKACYPFTGGWQTRVWIVVCLRQPYAASTMHHAPALATPSGDRQDQGALSAPATLRAPRLPIDNMQSRP